MTKKLREEAKRKKFMLTELVNSQKQKIKARLISQGYNPAYSGKDQGFYY